MLLTRDVSNLMIFLGQTDTHNPHPLQRSSKNVVSGIRFTSLRESTLIRKFLGVPKLALAAKASFGTPKNYCLRVAVFLCHDTERYGEGVTLWKRLAPVFWNTPPSPHSCQGEDGEE